MKKTVAVVILVLLFALCFASCGIGVPPPNIKEGEFTFSVTYEFYGEEKTVSGVYVCEYNGISKALDGSPCRAWKGYVKDGKTEDTVEIGKTKTGESIELHLDLFPDYFMGESLEGYRSVPKPYIAVALVDDEGTFILREPGMIEEMFGAKIISYDYGKPIENSFGTSK